MSLQNLRLLMITGLMVLAASPARAAPDIAALFGSRVKLNPHFSVPLVTGDFDGDGVPDTAYMVTVLPASARNGFAPGVTVLDGVMDGNDTVLGAHGAQTAPAIVQQGGKRKFLLTSHSSVDPAQGVFDSPIWSERPTPLSLAKRGSKAFRDFHAQVPQIRNDILVVGTEAGIDTALYWNGKTYVLFSPNEEP